MSDDMNKLLPVIELLGADLVISAMKRTARANITVLMKTKRTHSTEKEINKKLEDTRLALKQLMDLYPDSKMKYY